MKKILVTYPLPAVIEEEYDKEYSGRVEFTWTDRQLTLEEIKTASKAYQGIFIIRNKADRELIENAPDLEAIATFGVGYNNIDVETANERNIAVINTPVHVAETTAELAVSLMMSTMRGIVRYDRQIRDGIWKAPLFSDTDSRLHGKTLGIVGMGNIGRRVAAKARGLGMNVIYHNRHKINDTDEIALDVTYVTFEELLEKSDVISVHMPYTKENHHRFGMKEFQMMKKSAYFINTSRGAVVNEAELVEALENNVIKGAGLDVFENEPKVSEGLLKLDNVVLTSHCGSATLDTRMGMAKEALDGLCSYLLGGQPFNLVNAGHLHK